MKILIINGNPDEKDSGFDGYIGSVMKKLKNEGHDTESILLREKSIKPCNGCFGCWIKTPGMCVIHDDAIEMTGQYLSSDLVILATPLVNGYFSYLLKNALDRNISVMHPHLEEVDGEVHHLKRYDAYPSIAFILGREKTTDDEDMEILGDIISRMSINMRNTVEFIKFTGSPVEEVADAVNIH